VDDKSQDRILKTLEALKVEVAQVKCQLEDINPRNGTSSITKPENLDRYWKPEKEYSSKMFGSAR
jgi:hypothetical protein